MLSVALGVDLDVAGPGVADVAGQAERGGMASGEGAELDALNVAADDSIERGRVAVGVIHRKAPTAGGVRDDCRRWGDLIPEDADGPPREATPRALSWAAARLRRGW